MTTLNTLLMVLIPIGVGISLGQLLFAKKGGTAVTIYSAIGTMTATFWVIIGIFMIIGGFHAGGIVVIMFAWFLARGNYNRFKQERGNSTRASIANGGS